MSSQGHVKAKAPKHLQSSHFFRHFVREVLDTIAPPYSAEFVQVVTYFDYSSTSYLGGT